MKLWRYGRPIERLGQRYRLEGMLGSGGMADVCLAWDERAQRDLAIKVIRPDELDQRTLDRFLKEAAQVATWRHPNIVRIFGPARLELLDAAQGSVVPYIVMEYAQGGDLHKRLTPGQPYSLDQTLNVFAQICSAVAYAHEHGIIHRDLKPLNILFRHLPDGRELAALSDFGLAVEMGATHFTFAGAGTLPYMAPEQLRGRAEAASDIFALGVILYQLCTGRLPFRRTLQNLRHPTPQPPLPTLLNSELPAGIDEVIFTALADAPQQRYSDAHQLWDAVATAVEADPATVHLLDNLGGSTWEDAVSPSSDSSAFADFLPSDRSGTRAPSLPSSSSPNSARPTSNSRTSSSHTPAESGSPASSRRSAEQLSSPGALDLPMPVRTRSLERSSRVHTDPVSARTSSYSSARRTRVQIPTTSPQLPITTVPRPARRRKLWPGLLVGSALLISAVVATLAFGLPAGLPALFNHTHPTGTTRSSSSSSSKPTTTTRSLSITSPSQTLTVTGTGHTQIPGVKATGELTFSNGSTSTVPRDAGFTVAGVDGISVTVDDAFIIPGSNPPNLGIKSVPAHATNAGVSGNIKALDINQVCCVAGSSLFVRDINAFTGGKDPQDYVFVQQSDVDAVVGPAEMAQKQQVQVLLQRQLRAGEQISGPVQCTPTVQPPAHVGDTGANVPSTQVTLATTCLATARG